MFLLKIMFVLAVSILIQAKTNIKDRKFFKSHKFISEPTSNYMKAYMSMMNALKDFDSYLVPLNVDDINTEREKEKKENENDKKIFKKYFSNRFKGVSSFHRDFHTMRI